MSSASQILLSLDKPPYESTSDEYYRHGLEQGFLQGFEAALFYVRKSSAKDKDKVVRELECKYMEEAMK